MKNKALTYICLLAAVAALLFTAPPALAQGSFAGAPPQNQATFGFTQWAINNQRVASQFNYVIDTRNGLGSNLGLFTFPATTCTGALTLPARGGVDPMAFLDPAGKLPQVRIVDNTSANSETVSQNSAPSFNGTNGNCTLSLATSNTHSQGSYFLTSPTCGLREALDDLGTTGGVVIVNQEWYSLVQGCTQSTITGIAGQLLANQYIHDVSNGQDVWYGLKPTATTLISPPSAPTTGTVAGGTFTNGNVLVSVTYVDALGGETLASSETTQATGGTTNGLTVTSPAAATGAVGYRVYMTAVGGSTLSGVLHTTTTNCTQTTLETVIPACAIGATTTVLAPITSTSKIPAFGTAHSTIAFQPFNSVPPLPPGATSGTFYAEYLPFASVSTVTAGSTAEIATAFIPPGIMNWLGKSLDICFKIASTNAATAVPTLTLQASTAFEQSSVTLDTVLIPTQTGAVTTTGCFNIQTAVTGSSGKFWASTLGPVGEAINSTGVVVNGMDVTTAVSSAVDLTKGIYLELVLGATTANITSVTVNNLTVRPTPGT